MKIKRKKTPKTNFGILLIGRTYQHLIQEARKVIFKLVLRWKKIKNRQKLIIRVFLFFKINNQGEDLIKRNIKKIMI